MGTYLRSGLTKSIYMQQPQAEDSSVATKPPYARHASPSDKSYYPPEWAEQASTCLAYPHNYQEWSERGSGSHAGLEHIRDFTDKLISTILDYQDVRLIFNDAALLNLFEARMQARISNKAYKLHKHIIPNNDIWIRDYGPFFVYRDGRKTLVDFAFNAWGAKFPPWDLDDILPLHLAQQMDCAYESVDLILEGGSLEFNGQGLLMTTEQCLLNTNRNPHLTKDQIENIIKDSLGQNAVIWLPRGLEGDHTDGHIDDFARFIAPDTVLLCEASSSSDPNYEHLRESKRILEAWLEPKLRVISLPLPTPMRSATEILPCSYANFIFVNGAVIVPVFNCPQDEEALEIFSKALPDRKIQPLDGSFLIEGGGGIHCMSKQEPA